MRNSTKFRAGHEIFGEGAGNFGVRHRDFGVGAEKKTLE